MLVDICEKVKLGGKVIRIYKGVFYREHFKVSPFKKVIEKFFVPKTKTRRQKNVLKQGLVKLKTNSFYGVQIRKVINESNYCISETWMKTDYVENVLDYWKLPNEICMVKLEKVDGLDDGCDVKKNFTCSSRSFFLKQY